MAQILIMGASITYGVGGAHGGWADLVKLYLHEHMYAKNAVSEAHEVHIFAKPDATVQFVLDTHERCIADYRRDNRKTVVVLSIGMNDTKAVDNPAHYLNTPNAYKASMTTLLNSLATVTDAVLCVGFPPVDESRTSPKHNPFTGKRSYFTNERIQKFDAVMKEAVNAVDDNVTYLDVAEHVKDGWLESCLSADGLHPNESGHRRIFDTVIPEINRLIAS